MQPDVIQTILALNHQFYQTFGAAFAATRQRIQPGVARILERLPDGGHWLDLGCGSGALAAAWTRRMRRGSYLGLDFSPALLEEARQALPPAQPAGLSIRFASADLSDPGWTAALDRSGYNGVLAFAVLHHIPGAELRRRLLRQARSLLPAGGQLILSVWQFQHSPRLLARRQPWELAGLEESDVDEGDALLDWRRSLPGQAGGIGLRYVHLFSRSELGSLAEESGFRIVEEFESDGEGGRLGLYQVWEARLP